MGAGLAGLTTAIKLKRRFNDADITVVEKRVPQSNTQIAGQRFRAGIAGKRHDGRQEIESLLSSRNDNIATPHMKHFAEIAVEELEYWQETSEFVEYHDRPEWFGPQWGKANRAGKGRGKSVLDWMKHTAAEEGITFLQGEARRLLVENDHIEGIQVATEDGLFDLTSNRYVLAGGNMGGRLFLSTNKDIGYSPQELAFDAGLSLVGSTTHMIHPFGNADAGGNPRLGCFETDELAEADVYLDGASRAPKFDTYSTELLRQRQGHYYFPEIVQRFRDHGSVTRLDFPNGDSKFARVSYHYGHLGVETTDGVQVKGVDNLYAAGDASSISFWTEHHERFPGFALLKCIVDAKRIEQQIEPTLRPETQTRLEIATEIDHRDTVSHERIKQINTEYLGAWQAAYNPADKARVGEIWQASLAAQVQGYQGTSGETLLEISRAMAYAHAVIGSGAEREPFAVYASQVPGRISL